MNTFIAVRNQPSQSEGKVVLGKKKQRLSRFFPGRFPRIHDETTGQFRSSPDSTSRRPHRLSFDGKNTTIVQRKDEGKDEIVLTEAAGWKPLTRIDRYIRTALERGELKEIMVSEQSLTKDFFKSLEESKLESMPLTKVVMNNTGLSLNQFRRLLKSLPKRSLLDVDITWSGLNSESSCCLAKALPQFCNLQSLNLEGNCIGPRGLEALMDKGQLYKIRHLNLRDSFKYGDREVAIIGLHLSHKDCRIESLDLSMNGISSRGMQSLVRGLCKNNGSLKSLQLDGNNITNDMFSAILHGMVFRENLYIPLVELSLRNNCIDGDGIVHIAKLLVTGKLRSLRTLNLGKNPINDTGVVALAAALGHSCCLEDLSLDSCSIGCHGLMGIVNSLTTNQRLKRLSLGNNDLPVLNRLVAPKFLKCLRQSNITLGHLELLEDNYDNHLILDKLDYFLESNRCYRRNMHDLSVPLSAWPKVIAKVRRPDVLYVLLRERPDLLEQRCAANYTLS